MHMPARLQDVMHVKETKSDLVNAIQLKQRLVRRPEVADVVVAA